MPCARHTPISRRDGLRPLESCPSKRERGRRREPRASRGDRSCEICEQSRGLCSERNLRLFLHARALQLLEYLRKNNRRGWCRGRELLSLLAPRPLRTRSACGLFRRWLGTRGRDEDVLPVLKLV